MSTRRVTTMPRMNLGMNPSGPTIVAEGAGGALVLRRALSQADSVELIDASLRSAERARRPFPQTPAHSFRLENLICLEATGFADYVCHLGQVVLFLRGRKRDC